MNWFQAFFKKRKNRDILLYVSAGLALLLPIASYLLEEQYGEGILWLLYTLSPICFICVIVAVVMLIVNACFAVGKKMRDRKDE